MKLISQSLENRDLFPVSNRNHADEELSQLVNHTLRRSSYTELHHLTCTAHEGCVTISGVVQSYWLKQLAQSEVQRIPDVGLIHNKLAVCR